MNEVAAAQPGRARGQAESGLVKHVRAAGAAGVSYSVRMAQASIRRGEAKRGVVAGLSRRGSLDRASVAWLVVGRGGVGGVGH